MAKYKGGNWEKKAKVFKQDWPANVVAVQFSAKKFLDFEGIVTREPGAGANREDQGRFVFQGTDDIQWTVNDGDYIVFVPERVFPSYIAIDRDHSFVMSKEEFEAAFSEADLDGGPKADELPEEPEGEESPKTDSGVGTE